MSQMTAVQVAQYLVNSGFSGDALITMVSIAFAESSFDPGATNKNSDGTLDRGLFQINSGAHPDVSAACAYDPQCAANAAWKISSQGKNFHPWAVYTSGKYTQYLPNTIKELRGVTFKGQNPNDLSGQIGQNSPPPGSGGTDLINSAIQGAFAPIIQQLPSFGLHIGLALGALMMVIIGFWILSSNPAPVESGAAA